MHILENSCGGIISLYHIQFGQGKDVIFLHGWGGDIRSFFASGKDLSSDFRVTIVDFYGFGNSSMPDYPLFLDDYVDGVVEIIRKYQMNKVYLVGHSFGGRVALRLASRFGYMLEGIVLVDSAGLKPRRKPSYYMRLFRHKILCKLNIEDKSGSSDYQKLSGTMKTTFKNIVNEFQDKELKYITLPTLIIWGDKDKDTPIYMAKRIRKKIVNSSLIVFEGAGHFSYLERIGLFNIILKKFFAGGEYGLDYCFFGNGNRSADVVKIPRVRTTK